MSRLEKYSSYKDSGIMWIGSIPIEWEVQKLKFMADLFTGNSISDSKKSTYEYVQEENFPYIATKDIKYIDATVNYKNGLSIPKRITTFKIAPKNSTLLCIEGGSAGKKIAYINSDVCFVNKLACINSKNEQSSKYLYYLTKSGAFDNQFKLSMNGLIGGVSTNTIKNFYLLSPPKEEQTNIANFLDKKIAQIDEAIKQKEELISLLKERRQVLIHKAVTQGLDTTVKMKDSGVEWLGEVPTHWDIKALKYLLKERNDRSETGEETLFMMSQIHGLVVRADFHDKAVVAQSSVGNKKVHKNDLVFNKLKAHLGVFSKSNIDDIGIVSPDYAVYFSIGEITDVKYLELLFKNPIYISHFIRKATGIVEGLIRLYTDDLFSLKVPVPPESEQKKILAYVDKISIKIDTAISFQEKEIEKIKEYNATLIDSVVTGKVRVV